MNPEPTTPSTLPTRSIAQAIAQYDAAIPHHPLIRVEGEVSDLSRANSGHLYFRLSDGEKEIPCVMWKGVARTLPVSPRDGLLVAAACWIQRSPRGGLELDVRALEVRGALGPRSSAREELRKRLAAEGLLDPARKRALPVNPTCLGVVTSLACDVIHDLVRVLRRRAPGLLVHTVSTRVTGEGAADEIASAIRALSATGTASPIVVARGGGSAGDLAAYDSEVVVRAIAESQVPVVVAVGHEPNVSLADQVADLRCATASEAAELVTADSSPVLATGPASEISLRTGTLLVTVRVDPSPA